MCVLGEPKRMDNVFFRDVANENNVDNDESDYLVPISGGKEFNNYLLWLIKVYNL